MQSIKRRVKQLGWIGITQVAFVGIVPFPRKLQVQTLFIHLARPHWKHT